MAKTVWATAIGLLLCLSSGIARCAEPGAAELAAAQSAQDRGLQMFRYDQAAWHATDRFQADLKRVGKVPDDPSLNLAGYIVEPVAGGRLQVSFYSGDGQVALARARYVVDETAGVEGGILAEGADSTMSPLALRMIAARSVAMEQAVKPGHALCSSSAANTLVLPPDDRGVVSVYFLTSTDDAGIYPAGGHYRFDVAAGGKLLAERPFMKSCSPIDVAKLRREKARVMVLSHLLDPQPTEIHSFVNLNIGLPLMVVTTSNELVWVVASGRIAFVRGVKDK